MGGERPFVLFFGQTPRQPEVAKDDVTFLVYQNVGGFEVPVDDVGRVKIVDRAQEIIKHDLVMLLGEREPLRLLVFEQLFEI